jgi:heterodisulfide reductase subunit B
VALAARNLALAEKAKMDIVTLCSACYYTLSRTNKILREDSEVKSRVEEALSSFGLSYKGGARVRHFLEALLTDVGLKKIREKMKIPLTNLHVASYYGCLLVRPQDICNFDQPEHPTRMDELVETLGASKVEYYSKTRCCGASLGMTDEKIMVELSKNIMLDAKASGANCVITACPLCHFNLDAKQKDIESRFDLEIDMPILHFTQFIGLAFGIPLQQLGLHRNCVSPKKIMPQYGEVLA